MSDANYESLFSLSMQRFCLTLTEGSGCWCFVSVFVPLQYRLRVPDDYYFVKRCVSISVLFYCLIYAALSIVRKDRKQQNLFSKRKLNWGQPSSRKQHMNNLVLLIFQPRYQMFVVEQLGNDIFNKGRLMNTGCQYASNASGVNFDCYIFHDVDMLLENDKNIYKYIDFIFPCHRMNNSCFSCSEKPLGSNGFFKSYLS